MNGDVQQKPFFKREGFRTTSIIVLTLLSAYGLANLEVLRRARAAYLRGEVEFTQKHYKQALWSYQEVQEFYVLPHSHWVDDAAQKEWICRAYLGDFIPPEGPMDADVRRLRQDYEKYKGVIASITPVGDPTYSPSPLTTDEKKAVKKRK